MNETGVVTTNENISTPQIAETKKEDDAIFSGVVNFNEDVEVTKKSRPKKYYFVTNSSQKNVELTTESLSKGDVNIGDFADIFTKDYTVASYKSEEFGGKRPFPINSESLKDFPDLHYEVDGDIVEENQPLPSEKKNIQTF